MSDRDNLMVYKEPNMSDTELNFGYRTSLIYKPYIGYRD